MLVCLCWVSTLLKLLQVLVLGLVVRSRGQSRESSCLSDCLRATGGHVHGGLTYICLFSLAASDNAGHLRRFWWRDAYLPCSNPARGGVEIRAVFCPA